VIEDRGRHTPRSVFAAICGDPPFAGVESTETEYPFVMQQPKRAPYHNGQVCCGLLEPRLRDLFPMVRPVAWMISLTVEGPSPKTSNMERPEGSEKSGKSLASKAIDLSLAVLAWVFLQIVVSSPADVISENQAIKRSYDSLSPGTSRTAGASCATFFS
jgi:hypothetical protein